jgi:hypothetical protein
MVKAFIEIYIQWGTDSEAQVEKNTVRARTKSHALWDKSEPWPLQFRAED